MIILAAIKITTNDNGNRGGGVQLVLLNNFWFVVTWPLWPLDDIKPRMGIVTNVLTIFNNIWAYLKHRLTKQVDKYFMLSTCMYIIYTFVG